MAVNQELDAFAARLAHDLRGPLVNMRSILAMTLQDLGEQLDPQQAEMMRRGVQSGDLALRMVRDLLDFRTPMEVRALLDLALIRFADELAAV